MKIGDRVWTVWKSGVLYSVHASRESAQIASKRKDDEPAVGAIVSYPVKDLVTENRSSDTVPTTLGEAHQK